MNTADTTRNQPVGRIINLPPKEQTPLSDTCPVCCMAFPCGNHIRITSSDIGRRFRRHGPWGEEEVAVASIVEWTNLYGLPVWEDERGYRFGPYLPVEHFEPVSDPATIEYIEEMVRELVLIERSALDTGRRG